MEEELAPTLQNILDQVETSIFFKTYSRNPSNGFSVEEKVVSGKPPHLVPWLFNLPKFVNQSSLSLQIQVPPNNA